MLLFKKSQKDTHAYNFEIIHFKTDMYFFDAENINKFLLSLFLSQKCRLISVKHKSIRVASTVYLLELRVHLWGMIFNATIFLFICGA